MFTLHRSLYCHHALVAGLDIGASNIRLVEFSGRQQRQLERYASTPLPLGVIHDHGIDDLQRLIDTVRMLRETSGAQARRIAISLPTAMAITTQISLDAGSAIDDEDQLEAQARSHAVNILPYPLAQASIDFFVSMPSHPDGQTSLLIAAVRQEIIDDLLAMTEALALDAIAIDIACYADYRGWIQTQAALATTLSKCIAMLRIDDDAAHCSLFIDDQQNSSTTRCDRRTSPNSNTAKQLQQAATDLLRTAMMQIGDGQLDQIVLSGSYAGLANIASLLQQQWHTPTAIATPFVATTLAAGIDRAHLQLHAAAYLTASGAAVRSRP